MDTKTIERIGPLQIAQILTYLRFLYLRHGLILNFHTLLMKDGIRRVLNGYGKHISQKIQSKLTTILSRPFVGIYLFVSSDLYSQQGYGGKKKKEIHEMMIQ